MNCLLCESAQPARFKVVKKPERAYFHCPDCDLIFMDPAERLTPELEKQRYDLHQNESTAGYNAFLEPLVNKLDSYFRSAGVNPNQLTVLDYGCGPTAFLSSLLLKKGYMPSNYDLYYFPDQDQLRKTYHAITSTEVWEHLYDPKIEIERQLRLLKAGGLLAIMTSAHRGEAVFHDWHYRRDLTHVVFYSETVMKWIAQKYRLQLLHSQSPYFLFQKM